MFRNTNTFIILIFLFFLRFISVCKCSGKESRNYSLQQGKYKVQCTRYKVFETVSLGLIGIIENSEKAIMKKYGGNKHPLFYLHCACRQTVGRSEVSLWSLSNSS